MFHEIFSFFSKVRAPFPFSKFNFAGTVNTNLSSFLHKSFPTVSNQARITGVLGLQGGALIPHVASIQAKVGLDDNIYL